MADDDKSNVMPAAPTGGNGNGGSPTQATDVNEMTPLRENASLNADGAGTSQVSTSEPAAGSEQPATNQSEPTVNPDQAASAGVAPDGQEPAPPAKPIAAAAAAAVVVDAVESMAGTIKGVAAELWDRFEMPASSQVAQDVGGQHDNTPAADKGAQETALTTGTATQTTAPEQQQAGQLASLQGGENLATGSTVAASSVPNEAPQVSQAQLG